MHIRVAKRLHHRAIQIFVVVVLLFCRPPTAEALPETITPFPVLRAPGVRLQWVDDSTILMLAFDQPDRPARWITWSLDGHVTALKSLANADINANTTLCTAHSTIYHISLMVSSGGKIVRVVEVDGAAQLVETDITFRVGPGHSRAGFDCFTTFDPEMAGRLWISLVDKSRYVDLGHEFDDPVRLVFADTKPYRTKSLGIFSKDIWGSDIKYYKFKNQYFVLAQRRAQPAAGVIEIGPRQRCWKAWWFDSDGNTSAVCVAIPARSDVWSIVPTKNGYAIASSLGLHFFSSPIIADGTQVSGDFVGRFYEYRYGAVSPATSPDGCHVAAIATAGAGRGVARVIVENVCATVP